jgi:pimeloyl-ACP methyl ester carboxylesterase
MRFVLIVLGVLGGLYLGICVMLFALQRSMIYFPQAGSGDGVGERLEVDGARLVVTTREVAGDGAVVYFGGNAEDVTYSYPTLLRAFPDRALYLMNYRGYGGSSGKPTEKALVADGLALFDLVSKRHAKVVVVGRSLGSGVAVRVASERAVERLVLVTPFDSVQNVAAEMFRFLPVGWLLIDKYESWRYAPGVSAPTLVIAAERDEVIPMARTRALLESFRPGVASMKVIEGAGHNDISEQAEYMVLLRGNVAP